MQTKLGPFNFEGGAIWSGQPREGETFQIAMEQPFNYVETADYLANRMNVDTVDLVDPVGQDFCIDIAKARYVLGFTPTHDIFTLIDQAIDFRKSPQSRRQRSGYEG